MKIEQLMTREVKTVRPHDHLDQAARLMWENDCGCLPVVNDDGAVVGMITDRDVCMAAWTQGRAPAELDVRIAMSAELFTCGPNDGPRRVERIMQEHQVRRVPVTDEAGKLVGLVSLNDLARESQQRPGGGEVAQDGVARTLAAVCRPRNEALPQRASAPATQGLAAVG